MQKFFIKRARQDINIISNEISDLLHKEDVFQKGVKTLIKDKKIDGYSAAAIVNNHYSTVLVAIRRQLGTNKSEISLLKLLEKLKTNHKLITKKWYSSQWLKDSPLVKNESRPGLRETIKNFPVSEFEENFGQEELSVEIVDKDIAKLKSATGKIKTFVDKRLAHRDKKPPNDIEMKNYLDSLKAIESIAKKYILLLEQTGTPSLTPVMQ